MRHGVEEVSWIPAASSASFASKVPLPSLEGGEIVEEAQYGGGKSFSMKVQDEGHEQAASEHFHDRLEALRTQNKRFEAITVKKSRTGSVDIMVNVPER